MKTFQLVQLVITVGAAARLTRLVTRDAITQPLRDRLLYDRDQRAAQRAAQPLPAPARPRAARIRAGLHELATCDWCAGMWVSAAVVVLAYSVGPHPVLVWPAAALTVSHVVGWLAGHENCGLPSRGGTSPPHTAR